MAEYDSTRAMALRLIKKKGRADVKLYRVAVGTVSDPAKPWKADGGAATDQLIATVHAVFLSPVEARGSEGQFAIPVYMRARAADDDSVGSDVTAMVYIADIELPDGVNLDSEAMGVIVESEGISYAVLRCQTYTPGEVPILHILSVKG
jgi:hypothetical protein